MLLLCVFIWFCFIATGKLLPSMTLKMQCCILLEPSLATRHLPAFALSG